LSGLAMSSSAISASPTCYGKVANLLQTCYGETGVMDFAFIGLTDEGTRVGVRVRGPI